jgi:MinD-like ATPase involved in chromosome partitioning or flagellar assembly
VKLSTLPRQRMQELLDAHTVPFKDSRHWIEHVAGCLVIGIGMLKGGTGKTTSAIFLGLYLTLQMGLKVCIVDTDDNSQSVDNWYKIRERRDEHVPFDLVTYDPKDEDGPDLDDIVDELRAEYDVVIVDIGGAGKEAYWEMCKAAHLVLLPVAPSGYETTRIAPTIRQAAKGGKANEKTLRVFVVMIKCDNRTSLPDEQRMAVEATLAHVNSGSLEVHLVEPDFQISSGPEYPRSWEQTPKVPQLEEFGYLFRHIMKSIMAETEAAV